MNDKRDLELKRKSILNKINEIMNKTHELKM